MNALSVFNSPVGQSLHVGGDFFIAGGVFSSRIARWDGCPCIPGDMNRDGVVDLADVPAFVDVVLGIDTSPANRGPADVNRDGVPDGLDVQPFTAALTG